MADVRQELRTLVERFGPGVLADAEGLRSLLDDVLDEDASPAETNLLVDAVRFGAVERLRSLVEHGARPEAAVSSAGAFLATQRGGTDERSAVWACDAVGHALDLVPDRSENLAQAQADTLPSEPEADPDVVTVPRPPPWQEPSQDDRPTPVRRGWWLPVLVGLVVLAMVGGATAYVLLRDGAPPKPDAGAGPLAENLAVAGLFDPSVRGSDLVTIPVQGGSTSTLVGGRTNDILPSVSPDRETISFLRRGDDGLTSPYVMPADGSAAPEPLLGPDAPCQDTDRPSWNTAGTQLVVTCLVRDPADGDLPLRDGMWIIDADGSAVRELTEVAEQGGGAAWTNGDGIVYWAPIAGEPGQDGGNLWIIDDDGTHQRRLTSNRDSAGDVLDSHPDWSPDGSQLLFLRQQGRQSDVFTMEPEPGAEPVQRTFVGDATHPTWGPSGDEIIFVAEGGKTLLTQVDAGAAPQEVDLDTGLDTNGEIGAPAWGSR